VKFCTVCGEWFDGTAMALHCPRPAAEPLPEMPRLPHGDYGTIWPVPEHREQPARHEHVYSATWPTEPGYYVYRLWGDIPFAGTGCLYIGMVGENGPRRLSARLAEHKRTKSWRWQVERIDAAVSTLYDVGHEEALQIAKLRPEHNYRTEGWKLTTAEHAGAQGWDEGLFTPWREAAW
jgi:hypothetical protein